MGYFLIMIIFMIIAIVRAKNDNPWIWYGIGVGLQLLSLAGLTRQYSMYGLRGALNGTWIAFVVIAAVSLFLIFMRKKS